jgi:hypothetical protein
MSDGILSGPFDLDARPSTRPRYPSVPATLGRAVEHESGFRGAIVAFAGDQGVVLRDGSGRDVRFRNAPGAFRVDGRRVVLVTPPRRAEAGGAPSQRTASGSIAVEGTPARVARASRIYVEGLHDAELIEKVWGDDLRVEGIVVEPMHGMDDLETVVRTFGPRPGRRLGVLLDHLVEGSKEWHAARRIDHPDVLVCGHAFVDVWAAVHPRVVGRSRWPDVPRGRPWKEGVCAALGADEPSRFWRTLLGRVSSYTDLHHSLVGAVERLIDFVAEPTG